MKLFSPPGSRPTARTAFCALVLASVFLAALLAGCGAKTAPPPKAGYPRPYKIGNNWYQPIPDARGFSEKGVASWYGPNFHGKPTASGEIYDMFAMTAAHKTLPLGTRVRVTAKATGKSVAVRVNDRGPFVVGRVIDLSKAAATELGIMGKGTADVIVEALAAPAGTPADARDVYYTGKFTIQVGAFKEPANAERLVKGLTEKYNDVHVVKADVGGEIFYRVRLGKSNTLDEARKFESMMHKNGYPQSFVVAE